MTYGLMDGLAHERNNVCNEIDKPEVTDNNVISKRQRKSSIQKAITKNKHRNNMLI